MFNECQTLGGSIECEISTKIGQQDRPWGDQEIWDLKVECCDVISQANYNYLHITQ